MNASDLRLYLGRILETDLGTYTREAGVPIPAIYVVGRHQVPKTWGVQGIECVIVNPPDVTTGPNLAASVTFSQIWTVTLTQFDTEGPTLLGSTRKVLQHFPTGQVTPIQQTDTDYEQAIIRIPDAELLPNQYLNLGGYR